MQAKPDDRGRLRLIAVAVVLVAACGSSPSAPLSTPSLATQPATTTPSASDTESPAPSPTLSLPSIEPIDGIKGVVAITDIGQPDWVSIAGSSAWAAGVDDGIGRFDLTTHAQGKTVPMGPVCLAMDVAFDSLWVGDCDASRLVRIDPKTGSVVAAIRLPGQLAEESSVAAGEKAVWVILREPARLVRVDPKTNKITNTLEVPGIAAAIRAGAGGLWFISEAGTVYRLDPKSGTTVADIPVGHVPRFTAIGAGSVWVLNQQDGTVSRIDAQTNQVTATIPVSSEAIGGGDMAFGGGYAWARVSDALVAQIDPKTNMVVHRLGDPAGSGSVAADDDAVWISAHDVSTLWRVPLH